MDIDWVTPQEIGELWGIKPRRVQALCEQGRVNGAKRMSRFWLIPKNAPRPIDGRTKAAKRSDIQTD